MHSYVLPSGAAMSTALFLSMAATPAAAQVPTVELPTMPTIDAPATSFSPYSDAWTSVDAQMEQYDAAIEQAACEQAAQLEQWNRQNDAAVNEAILERVRQMGNAQPSASAAHDAFSLDDDPWKPVYEQMAQDDAKAESGASGAAIAVAVLIVFAAMMLVGLTLVAAVAAAVVVFVAIRSSRRRAASASNVASVGCHATT